jgi:hypothetical protein
MIRGNWKGSRCAFNVLTLFYCVTAYAQQIPHHNSTGVYDVARENVINGKVLQYTASPRGARILLQTSSGTVEVNAGNSKLISANHISLQAGDSVSVTGENVPAGEATVFLARIIQKGTQSVAVRSKTGMPLLATARTADGRIVSPEGVR